MGIGRLFSRVGVCWALDGLTKDVVYFSEFARLPKQAASPRGIILASMAGMGSRARLLKVPYAKLVLHSKKAFA